MMEERLKEIIAEISPLDTTPMQEIQAHLDNLTKPKGSLGRLEELAMRMALIQGQIRPEHPKKVFFVFAGDHGITEEGVSAFPKEVTYQMVLNFLRGGAGINVLARHAGADVRVVDIGVDHPLDEAQGLIRRKVAPGTRNMAQGPAMEREEALQGIMVGIELAQEAIAQGYGLLGTGEMGIGNTTPASALTAVITGRPVKEVTGRGTGIAVEALERKVALIQQAIDLNRPDPADPIDVLAKVGGLEIAGICGLVLGAAAAGVGVVVDGFISTAGALVAHALAPSVTDYIFAAHQSQEQGHRVQMAHMGLRPLLDLDLRLGEGTGAALAMTLIDAGIKICNEMATFEDAAVAEGNEAF